METYVDFYTGEIRPLFVRSAYNYDTNKVSDETSIVCKDKSLAIQSQKEEADINTIVRKFGVTGLAPQNVDVPSFQAFEDVFDFRTAMDAINAANRSFMAMDAEVRARFNNDPQRFIRFCEDEKNVDEMKKMGLAVDRPKPEEPKPQKVEIVNPRETSNGRFDQDASETRRASGRRTREDE